MQIIHTFTDFLKRKGIFLLVIFITASAVHTAYRLSRREDDLALARKRLSEEQAQAVKLEEIKNGLNSSEFVEKEARDKLGLAKEGEVVVVLPSEEVLRHFAPSIDEAEMGLGEASLPVWRMWVRLLLPEVDKNLPRG